MLDELDESWNRFTNDYANVSNFPKHKAIPKPSRFVSALISLSELQPMLLVCRKIWFFFVHPQRCSDKRVSDKRVFYTFARTLPSSRKVSKSVVALLKAFRWNRFIVVSGSHPASGSEVQEAIEVRTHCIIRFVCASDWNRRGFLIDLIFLLEWTDIISRLSIFTRMSKISPRTIIHA